MTLASFRNARAGSWVILLAIGVVVTAAWGVYAWRFLGSQSPQDSNETAVAEAGAAAPSQASGDNGITSLRAATPGTESHTQPAGGAGLTAPDIGVNLRPTNGEPGRRSSRTQSDVGVNAPVSVHSQSEEMQLRETPAEVAPEPDSRHNKEVESGRSALARGDLHAARVALSAALRGDLSRADEVFARAELERIADAITFSRTVSPNDPLASTHIVSSGESIAIIANRYKVTPGLLISLNLLSDPSRIRVGQRLKVLHGPFHAVIDKSDHRMDAYLGDIYVRSFRVGLGTNGGTPLGTWSVRNKLMNPEWADPSTGHLYLADDPENPIGERWIGLHGLEGECVGRTGFGIHGTIDPASIGENMSMGCIRMVPDDVAFMFDLLLSRHSRVTIRP
ncbi:MAG: L,D-transpeptidase family protein [Planctomycetota bacterium]